MHGIFYSLSLSYLRFEHAPTCLCVSGPVFVCAGEDGAAFLLVSLWHLPVQQWEGEGGPSGSGEDLLRVVTAATSQPRLEEHALLLPLRDCMSALCLLSPFILEHSSMPFIQWGVLLGDAPECYNFIFVYLKMFMVLELNFNL